MNTPLVSVIIPNYNHARFLDERIQSVLNQTYQNFEVIILDDKSTDNSVEVINKYMDNPHVSHIVVNEVNSGSTFKQWHKGFELAKGELIWVAESDDSCEISLLEILVRGYIVNNAVLAFCRSCRFDINGNRSIYPLQMRLPWDVVMEGGKFISEYMIDRNSVANASSAIFNRNIAMSIDKQYMTMRGEGDWLFWIELMEHGVVFFSTKELNLFRYHVSNTTNTLAAKGIGALEHKIVFDYNVKMGHIPSDNIKRTRIAYISSLCSIDYFESRKVKRKVFKIWDKYWLYRLYLLIKGIAYHFYIFFKNI